MTNEERKVIELALEALENLFGIPDKWTGEGGGDVAVWRLGGSYRAQQAITAIKEALAQPDQYAKGYADAMNWKVQNHLEHLPTAQPKQKPVAWKLVPIEPTREMLEAMDECSIEGYDEHLYAGHAASVYMAAVDVAPTPPQRKPLADEEIEVIAKNYALSNPTTPLHFARAIEAAHGIKE